MEFFIQPGECIIAVGREIAAIYWGNHTLQYRTRVGAQRLVEQRHMGSTTYDPGVIHSSVRSSMLTAIRTLEFREMRDIEEALMGSGSPELHLETVDDPNWPFLS